jgi:ATP-binding cassette, subfamily B, multidrug efflux pump
MKKNNKQRRKSSRFHYSTDLVIEKPFNWEQVTRLFSYMKPYAKTLLPLAIIAMLVSTAVRLLVPILIGVFVLDKAIFAKDINLLITIVAIISVLYVLNWIANTYRIKWMNQLGQYVIYDLRAHLFKHIQRLSHRFFDQRSAGSILVRITNDINSLQDLFTNGVINILTDLLMLIGIIAILTYLSPPLTLAIMVILPIMFFISTGLRRKIRRSWQSVRIKQAKLNSHLNESIQGIRVTQSYTQKNAMFRPFVEMSNAIGTAILIWYGASLIPIEGNGVTIGVFVTFAFYLGMFWEPISRLGQVYNQLLVGMASSERIFEFLDEKPSVPEKADAQNLKEVQGKIKFTDVEFAYDEKRKALNSINLEIDAGQTVALVGHTGSGKTTIANLITRFYDPTKGKVEIDNQDLRDLRLDSLRSQISIVLQDTFIFSGTIMENIRYGNPNATDEQVKKAAEAVGAHTFISKLNKGYETEVEERGNILSVGERQLLSFARTLLADPKIIILDEATASIDTETEVKIQEALKTLLKGRTAIIIAHRLSTIREADNIIVLDHGNIMEQGNHEQLMNHRGEYFDLVRAQFKAIEAS